MKIAYIGTPDFSARFLEMLVSHQEELDIQISVVLTQPDQPVGRKKVLTPSPVRVYAEKQGLPIITELNKIHDYTFDIAVLFAYGEIIPQRILDIPRYGFWNIHPSLLPAYRGASPITFPLLLGENKTGVTLMLMDKDLDHGPILQQEVYTIQNTDTRPLLEDKLTALALQVFISYWKKFQASNNIDCQMQDHASATFTRTLTKEDGYIPSLTLGKALNNEMLYAEEYPSVILSYYQINLGKSPPLELPASMVVNNMFRALVGWPGLWTTVTINRQEKRLKITGVQMNEDSSLTITEVQLEGKNPVDFKTFQNAYHIF